MRVLLVTHYFPPEVGAPQARLSEMAAAWAAEGVDVTVLTGMPNHPLGVVAPEYRGRIRAEEVVDGYRVVRTWLYATPNRATARKTLGHLSFMVSSVLLGWRRVGRPDAVVVSSPTFFSIFAAWFLARMKGARFVVEVRDLWPAIFVQLDVLTDRRLIRILETAELASYRAADAVVVVTEGFRTNLLERGIPAAKVHTIPNGVALKRFAFDLPARDEVRARLGAGAHDTLVLYAGAHGLSHGLTAVAEAAAKLDGSDIHFAFVGEGAAKEELERRVAELRAGNVVLLPAVGREEMPDVVAAADICLVPLRDVPLFSTFIPSKMFEFLAAGRPVIGALRGEAAGILGEAGAVVVPPENPVALADAVRELAGDSARRATMARQGRAYVEANFDRAILAERYRRLLASLEVAG